MKTLIWKEWREHRLFFFLAVGIIILSRFLPKLVPGVIRNHGSYGLIMHHIILPIFFSLFLAAISFTNDLAKNTKSFLLSHPITTARLFWVKYLSGLILLTILVLLTHIVFGIHNIEFSGTNIAPIWYFYSPIIYSAACFTSLLLKSTLQAIICTPFITLFGFFLVLPLIPVLLLICPSYLSFNLSILFILLATFFIFSCLTWQKALVKDASPRKTVRTISVLILAFSLGIHAIANLAASRTLNKTIKQAKAEGIRLTPEEVIPPPVSDKDNAALVYQQAFDLLDKLKDKYKTEWEYMPYEGKIKTEELPAEQKRTISRILQEPDFKNFYALIEKAVNMSACRFNINYNFSGFGPDDNLQPILGKMRSMARLVAARTYMLSEARKYDVALKSAATGLRLGDSLTNEPVLITQMVRIAMDIVAVNSYNPLLSTSRGTINADDYREIIDILDRKNRQLTLAIEGEPILFNGYQMESIYLNMGKRTSKAKRNYLKIQVYMLMPTLKAENAFYMQSIMKLVGFYNQPYYSIKDSLASWEKKIAPEAKIPPRYILARMAIPALSNSIIQQANYQATLDTFKLALALKIYREKHGNYPDTLSPLAPEIIPELLLDPFTGKDYIYRRKGKGFIVYSVGLNEKDDNGIKDSKQNYDDISFKVTN